MYRLFQHKPGHAFTSRIALGLKKKSSLSSKKGVALLMVLVVITILTTMVVSFTDTTQKNLQVTQYYKDRLQAYNTAQSGLEIATAVLRHGDSIANMAASLGYGGASGNKFDGATSPWHFESDIYEATVLPLLAIPLCESSFIEPAIPVEQAAAGETSTGMAMLFDENSKISLFRLFDKNAFGTPNEKTNEVTFARLSVLLELLLTEQDLVPANQPTAGITTGPALPIDESQADRLAGYLVDWIDTVNNQSVAPYNIDQAEDHCEDGLPYVTKNGRMDSIDELGLVCGFRQMSWGTIDRLTRYLTIYDLDTNINTASLSVLKAIFYAAGTASPEEQAEDAYIELHGTEDGEPAKPITGNIGAWLTEKGITQTGHKANLANRSDHFLIGVYGVVYDMETMAEKARSKVKAVLLRPATKAGPVADVRMVYYRED